MKCKIPSPMLKVYSGYYKDIKIAMSQDKDILKFYLENNRHLSKKDYDISKEYIVSDQYYLYEKYMITEFYKGIFIPNIDISIIGQSNANLLHELRDAEYRLYHLAALTSQSDKLSQDSQTFKTTASLIHKYITKSKYFDKIEKENNLNHPILSCNIDAYLNFVNQFNENEEMRKQYEYRIYDND